MRRFREGEPVEAHPPSWLYRSRKFIVRHRGVSLLFLLAATCLTLTALFTSRAAIKAADALAATQTALANAEQSAAVERASLTFIERLFDPIDIGERTGRGDVTVREVLDRASAQLLAKGYEGEPKVEAVVCQLIGKIYLSLGQTTESQAHLIRALELNRAVYGPDSDRVLETLHYLARIYRLTSLDLAEDTQREVVRIRRARSGPDSPYVAQALVSLGIGLRTAGKFDLAEQAYTEALAIYRRGLGENDENVAQTRGSLAVLCLATGRLEEGEQHAREAIRIGQLVHGDRPHRDTAAYRYNLGRILFARGNYTDGERELRASIQMEQRIPGSPAVASRQMGLADCLAKINRAKEAEALLRSIIQSAPPTSADSRAAVDRLARLMIAGNAPAEAEALCTECIAKGGDRADLRAVLTQLGIARTALGQFPQAREHLLEAWAFATTNPGPERQRVARALVELLETWERRDPGHGHAAEADLYRAHAAPAEQPSR